MGIAWVFIIIALVIAALVGLALAVYMAVYKRKIALRLSQGRSEGKKMMSPSLFFVITLVCVIPLGLILTILVSRAFYSAQNRGMEMGMAQPSLRAVGETALEDSPFSGYTTGAQIKGYDMTTYNDGDTTFYCYTADDSLYGVLPRMLICVDDGGKDVKTLRMKMDYRSTNADGAASFIGTPESAVLYALDADGFDGTLDLEFCGITTQEYVEGGEKMDEEYFSTADVKGSLTLDMAYPEEE